MTLDIHEDVFEYKHSMFGTYCALASANCNIYSFFAKMTYKKFVTVSKQTQRNDIVFSNLPLKPSN